MALKTFSSLAHLRRAQRWHRARIERSQLALLRATVSAAGHIPLYRDLYAPCDADVKSIDDLTSFHRLPMVTKGDIKASFPDRIVADTTDPRDLYQVATSGTTDRVMLFHDERKRDWDRAADFLLSMQGDRHYPGRRQAIIPPDACYERCGVDEHGRVDTVTRKLADLVRAPRGQRKNAARAVLSQFMRDYVWRCKFLKAVGVDGTATAAEELDTYIGVLRDWRPNTLSALPMYLYVLAKHLMSKGPDGGLLRGHLANRLRPSGGKLTDEMIRVVESAFGAPVRENFGTAELGTMAFDCPDSRTQHLLGELFYVEFLRGGRHVAPGVLGEMVVTDLRNHAAPLIRYRVGDVGMLADGACACGFEGTRFSVDGRLSEIIVTPAGDAFAGPQIVDFFLSRPDVDFVKVIQKAPDRFLAEIVPPSDRTSPPPADELSESFSRFLGFAVRVQPRRVRRLAPERSGKYSLVESSSCAAFHDAVSPRCAPETTGRCGEFLKSVGDDERS